MCKMDGKSFWKLILVIVIIVLLIIVVVVVAVLAANAGKNSRKKSVNTNTNTNTDTNKDRNKKQHHKSCGCVDECNCERETCPQCPNCPDCPNCPPVCPNNCADCPTCPKGLGGNCTANIDCAEGLKCVSQLCTCVKPNFPMGLTAIPQINPNPLGYKLLIEWDNVTNATFYNVFINGPTPKTYLFYHGKVLLTDNLDPGYYTITVYSGNNCGTSPTNNTINIIVPLPQQFCEVNENCPPGAPYCNQAGTCVACVTDVNCYGDTPICNTQYGICVPDF